MDNFKKYTRRKVEDFSEWKCKFQVFGRFISAKTFFKLFYDIKYVGRENIVENKKFIIAPNHISYFDPFLAGELMRKPLAFMGKKELFENKILAFLLDQVGCFAVNREKLEVSTMKTAIDVCKTEKWHLGIFPQGGIRKNHTIENINKGFAVLAKQMKIDILPVSIIGLEKYNWNIFCHKTIKIELGEPISYEQSYDEILEEWSKKVAKMSDYKYISPQDSSPMSKC